jgi:hypothetical protein
MTELIKMMAAEMYLKSTRFMKGEKFPKASSQGSIRIRSKKFRMIFNGG